jgi:hypothetical protein
MLFNAGLTGLAENTQIVFTDREHFSTEIANFLVSTPLGIVRINPAQTRRFSADKNPHLEGMVIVGQHLGTTLGTYHGILIHSGHIHLSKNIIGQRGYLLRS